MKTEAAATPAASNVTSIGAAQKPGEVAGTPAETDVSATSSAAVVDVARAWTSHRLALAAGLQVWRRSVAGWKLGKQAAYRRVERTG